MLVFRNILILPPLPENYGSASSRLAPNTVGLISRTFGLISLQNFIFMFLGFLRSSPHLRSFVPMSRVVSSTADCPSGLR